jgi:hypothetical protein
MPWRAGVAVFSGQPDPAWSIPDEDGHRIAALWAALPAVGQAPPSRPCLGYRGAFVDDGEHRSWAAHEGFVSLQRGRSCEWRADPERRFERTITCTAPEGALSAPVRELLAGVGIASREE